mgnify:CR=1 FL=1
MTADRFWDTKFAWLRYAVVWVGYAWMRTVVLLPLQWQLALGRALGRASRHLVPKRVRIVARNLEACLPELSPAARHAILVEHFAALGASLVEMSMGWFGNAERVRSRVRIDGAEHLAAALEIGRAHV